MDRPVAVDRGSHMDEVAAIPVDAEMIVLETSTFLGLIFGVELVVLAQFLGSVGEFAPSLIGTVSVLHESLAELGLLLAGTHLH